MRNFNLGAILLEIVKLSFIVFLPIPLWLKLIIFFILGFIGNLMPFITIPFIIAGWVWSYIYIWINIQHTGLTIFYMIMLLLFGLVILLMKIIYQNMSPLHRPPIVTTKIFSIGMWIIAICALIADIAMLIHLLHFNT